MSTTAAHDERMAKLTFASVYPLYVTKVERKNRREEETKEVLQSEMLMWSEK